MRGVGRAGGAGTIVNAFATGRGAAFGLAYHVVATAETAEGFRVWSNGNPVRAAEARLAIEASKAAQRRMARSQPLALRIETDLPSKKGLKSSSAVAVAVARATADCLRKPLSDRAVLDVAAEAGLRSRTSLTGAYDDAAACLFGGVVLTDNRTRRIVRRDRLPRGLVALVHIPPQSRATGRLDAARFRPLADAIEAAWELARQGRYREAMLVNTFAYASRLGQRPQFTLRALEAGAYAAGLSGKGPAEVALVPADAVADVSRRIRMPHQIVRLAHGGNDR